MTPSEKQYLDQLRITFLDAGGVGAILPLSDGLREHIRTHIPDVDEETAGRILLSTGGFFLQFNKEGFPGDRSTLQALTTTCLMAATFMVPWTDLEEGTP